MEIKFDGCGGMGFTGFLDDGFQALLNEDAVRFFTTLFYSSFSCTLFARNLVDNVSASLLP